MTKFLEWAFILAIVLLLILLASSILPHNLFSPDFSLIKLDF